MEKKAYEAVQIDEKSWRIEENGVRSFLFAGTDRAMLVDSGYGTGNLKEIVDGLTNLPIMLVNTHADRDHVGCNQQFEKAYMHPSEFDRYRQTYGAEIPAEPVWEGDIIDLGGRCFEVILILGHTPGSIALLDAGNRALVSGDSVQAGMIFMFGPGRNIGAYIHGMEKLLRICGHFDTVYPSHGPFHIDAGIIEGLIGGAVRGFAAAKSRELRHRSKLRQKYMMLAWLSFCTNSWRTIPKKINMRRIYRDKTDCSIKRNHCCCDKQ